MYLRLTFAKFLSKNDCFKGGAGILTSTGFGDFSEIHSEINRKLRKHLFLLLFLQFLGVLWGKYRPTNQCKCNYVFQCNHNKAVG